MGRNGEGNWSRTLSFPLLIYIMCLGTCAHMPLVSEALPLSSVDTMVLFYDKVIIRTTRWCYFNDPAQIQMTLKLDFEKYSEGSFSFCPLFLFLKISFLAQFPFNKTVYFISEYF